MTMANKQKRVLGPLGETELRQVRGGMLWPAAKMTDATVSLSSSDIYVEYGDIAGESTR